MSFDLGDYVQVNDRVLAWYDTPGKTPYTKDSEAMNCETSAIGR